MRTPDHKTHTLKIARLKESLDLALERHVNRADNLDDPAVMRADEMDLVRAERLVNQLEELTRECVGDEYLKQELDKMNGPERMFDKR